MLPTAYQRITLKVFNGNRRRAGGQMPKNAGCITVQESSHYIVSTLE